ncbi:hypothetical protein FI667_g12576, partial [Globisporangium splendens]
MQHEHDLLDSTWRYHKTDLIPKWQFAFKYGSARLDFQHQQALAPDGYVRWKKLAGEWVAARRALSACIPQGKHRGENSTSCAVVLLLTTQAPRARGVRIRELAVVQSRRTRGLSKASVQPGGAVGGEVSAKSSSDQTRRHGGSSVAALVCGLRAHVAVAPSLAATTTPSAMLSAAPEAPLFASTTAAFYPTAQGTRASTVPEHISAFTQQPQPFSSFAFTAPSAVAPFPSQSSSQQQPHLSMLMSSISTPQVSGFASGSLPFTQRQVADPTSRASFPSSSQHHTTGATELDGDPEFLASGVSHDKAQRFSVQEWMASKNRSNSAPSQSNSSHAAAHQQQQQFQLASQMNLYQPQLGSYQCYEGDTVHTTLMAQLFPQPLQPHHNDESSSDSSGIASQIRLLNLHRFLILILKVRYI